MKRILIIGLFACSVALHTNAAILPVAPQVEILDEVSAFLETIRIDLDIVADCEINIQSTYVEVLKSDYSTPSFSVRMKGAVFLSELGNNTAELNAERLKNDYLNWRRARDGIRNS